MKQSIKQMLQMLPDYCLVGLITFGAMVKGNLSTHDASRTHGFSHCFNDSRLLHCLHVCCVGMCLLYMLVDVMVDPAATRHGHEQPYVTAAI